MKTTYYQVSLETENNKQYDIPTNHLDQLENGESFSTGGLSKF